MDGACQYSERSLSEANHCIDPIIVRGPNESSIHLVITVVVEHLKGYILKYIIRSPNGQNTR